MSDTPQEALIAKLDAVKYLRDLAQRLLDYPTEHYKEAHEALIAYADEECEAADRLRASLPTSSDE